MLVALWCLNATFNNISVISWRLVLLVEETTAPGKNHWPVASHWQTLSHNVVSSTHRHEGFELTTLVVIGTDYTGSCKSNYHMITNNILDDINFCFSSITKTQILMAIQSAFLLNFSFGSVFSEMKIKKCRQSDDNRFHGPLGQVHLINSIIA